MGAMTVRRPRGDEGVGLPELLVSMAMFGIVVAALGAVFVGLLDTTRIASTRTATTADARIAMEAMTRSLRVAIVPPGEEAAITVSEPNRVQFYSSLARGPGQDSARPTRVTYVYDAGSGCVNETQVLADGPVAGPFTWPGGGTTKCLIRTSSPPVFTYYTAGTIEQLDGTVVAPIVPTTPDQRATVVSVEAALDVQDPDQADINGVIARDRVTLSNVISTNASEES